MRAVAALLLIAVAVVAGYFLLYHPQPESTDTAVGGDTIGKVPAGAGDVESRAGTAIDEALKQEAETYIREISQAESDPVDVIAADDFITGDQIISLGGKRASERVKPADLLALNGVSDDSPITVITEQEQVENVNVAKILEDAGGRLDSRIRILEDGEIREATVEDVIAGHDRDEVIPVIKKVETYEIRTPAEILADPAVDKNRELKIIREPYKLETTTVGELLMETDQQPGKNVYYVRNVTEDDVQGIWGIVHNGLIDNFATGIALRRGETIRKYRIDIPRDADEMRGDSTSSYLGRLIQQKTSESFVYNFRQGKMGRNPDLIYPGQEIIIIKFSTDELINIYRHFVVNS